VITRGKIQVRVIRTALAEKLLENPGDQTFTPSPNALEEAWVGGNLEANTLPAGQIAGLINEVKTVKEIIEEMVTD
jgi:NAD(P)H-dependent flavin oxidoreductase YrpB (nitropropane dioxygenase family)